MLKMNFLCFDRAGVAAAICLSSAPPSICCVFFFCLFCINATIDFRNAIPVWRDFEVLIFSMDESIGKYFSKSKEYKYILKHIFKKSLDKKERESHILSISPNMFSMRQNINLLKDWMEVPYIPASSTIPWPDVLMQKLRDLWVQIEDPAQVQVLLNLSVAVRDIVAQLIQMNHNSWVAWTPTLQQKRFQKARINIWNELYQRLLSNNQIPRYDPSVTRGMGKRAWKLEEYNPVVYIDEHVKPLFEQNGLWWVVYELGIYRNTSFYNTYRVYRSRLS